MTDANLGGTDATWERLAREDPLWAILSDPSRRGGRWQLDEFFATGESEIAALMGYVDAIAPGLSRGEALDFGCGVGRLTRALAAQFERVLGIDVSRTMVEQARRLDPPANAVFMVNETTRLEGIEDGRFELVYSAITLQHVPGSAAIAYVFEFLRVLRPGGIAVFQLPARRRPSLKSRLTAVLPRSVRARRYGGIEMHGVSRSEVLEALHAHGAEVLDVREDGSAGAEWEGYRYAVRKPSPAS